MRAVILWVLVAALFAAVWWLASERNERHYHVVPQGTQLVIERGRFFPTGTAAISEGDKLYAPLKLPDGEKPPAEIELDDQNSLDRWLFDVIAAWARNAAKKNDTKTAAALVERASQLPGLSGAQMAQLSSLRADLAWDDAQSDLSSASSLLGSAGRKLELVKQNNGAHAADAAQLGPKVADIQRATQDLLKH